MGLEKDVCGPGVEMRIWGSLVCTCQSEGDPDRVSGRMSPED